MSTHKSFDKICCIVLVLTLLLTVTLLIFVEPDTEETGVEFEYKNRLFDTSVVHSIDIVMDDWDSFVANCKSEEYSDCTLVIDGESFENVAIRGKGNTSLTQVDSYGNDRYSFKVEFDHYSDSMSYYGLDKLCLNNIIQDNTYMKDYLCYRMMADMGVASPLSSYVYITVNGEDWGLYLAVEGVEEAFLQRNYGTSYGELYKPDSQSLGGGRGNGKGFEMDEFMGDFDGDDVTVPDDIPSDNMPNDGQGMQGNTPPDMGGGQIPDMPNGSQGMQGGQIPDMPNGGQGIQGGTPPDIGGGQMPDMGGDAPDMGNAPDDMQLPDDMGGNMGGSMMQGSDDVLLKYIDDDADSYENIFDNAKTDVTAADKNRLISSLKALSYGDAESSVDIDSVIRYFAVHNFVLNFDSYTGSMIHNYYLYEDDGKLSMIPWDYNLAFGGFQSMGSAEELVNYPIDTPVSGGDVSDRPMLAWIFENDKYLELYHKYLSELMSEYFDSGYFEQLIDETVALISPYVEKDPTKFCTYDEFETGAKTLKSFCLLRAESVKAQLAGTIGSTSDTQSEESFISADGIEISAMGSMNGGGAQQVGGFGFKEQSGDIPSQRDDKPAQESNSTVLIVIISVAVLIVGLIFAISFKNKR